MKYAEIVEALKEEVGLDIILGVERAVGGYCQACSAGDSILHISGRRLVSDAIVPVPFGDICLCADRKACREHSGEQRQEATEWLESVFVPL